MNIDLSKIMHSWYEDETGKKYDLDTYADKYTLPDDHCYTFHSAYPLQLNEEISSYGYHPKGKLERWLCDHFPKYYEKQSKKHRKDWTFSPSLTVHTTYNSMSDCIVAMVNSGDYTLSQAVWIAANSCERCMNVLCYTYLNGTVGYPEYSAEWKKCNTCCEFCKDQDIDGTRIIEE